MFLALKLDLKHASDMSSQDFSEPSHVGTSNSTFDQIRLVEIESLEFRIQDVKIRALHRTPLFASDHFIP